LVFYVTQLVPTCYWWLCLQCFSSRISCPDGWMSGPL